MKLFVDTWGWIALADRKESRHEAAAQLVQQQGTTPGGQILTSDYVLDEMLTLLFRRRPFSDAWRFVQGILASSAERSLTVEPVSPERFLKALELRRRFADKPGISFTDLTSMVIMQALRVGDILTADQHFRQVGLGFQTRP